MDEVNRRIRPKFTSSRKNEKTLTPDPSPRGRGEKNALA
jgi:hypothetical protein